MSLAKYNPATEAPDEVRWFDKTGTCKECAKPAIGVLRGPRNETYGPYCQTHADRRLATAKAEREAYAKEAQAHG